MSLDLFKRLQSSSSVLEQIHRGTGFFSSTALAVLLIGAVGCPKDPQPTKPPTSPTTTKKEELLPPFRFSSLPSANDLVILHTSDNESDILGSGASAGSGGVERGGIGRAVSVMNALRANASAPVLTVAAGDTLMPAPELKVEIDKKNAVSTANNLLGYDVSALGNHEFDYGESYLSNFVRQANFPYLSATITIDGGPLAKIHAGGGTSPGHDVTLWASQHKGKLSTRALVCVGSSLVPVPPQTVPPGAAPPLHCPGSIVGVVGATTERLRTLSNIGDSIKVLDSLDAIKDAVQSEVDILTSQGVNFIVLLSHLQDVRKEVRLLELGLTGVDVIVAGGGDDRLSNATHRLLDGEHRPKICNTLALSKSGPHASCYPLLRMSKKNEPVLIVATDGQLKYIGHLAVSYDKHGVLTGFNQTTSRPWAVDETSLLELRAEISKEALAFETQVRDYLAPLMRTIATTSVFLDGTREHVRNRETNLGNLSADAMMWAATAFAKNDDSVPAPAFALRNGGGSRASIGSIDADTSSRSGGPIRMLDIESAFRFNNDLVIATVTHADLRSSIESALRGVGTARGSFPQFSQEIALSFHAHGAEQTHVVVDGRITAITCPGARVRSLSFKGSGGSLIKIVDDGVLRSPAAKVSFVTLAYMAKGGDGAFPTATDRVQKVETDVTEQGSIVGFIAAQEAASTWNNAANYRGPTEADPKSFRRIRALTGPAPKVPANCN